MKVSYDKATIEDAKTKGFGLFTIEYEGTTFPKGSPSWRGGITVQGPLSPAKAKLLLDFIKKFKEAP